MSIETIEQIDRLMDKVGGRFILTALLQKRIQEVIRGSPSFVDAKTPLRAALAEIEQGKIQFHEVSEEDEEE